MSFASYDATRSAGFGDALARTVRRVDRDFLARWVSWAVLFGCLFVLGVDLRGMVDARQERAAALQTASVEPVVIDGRGTASPVPTPAPRPLPRLEGRLEQPISFMLTNGGVISATGTIDEGAAGRFAEMLDLHGPSVTAVSLDSPGGSLDDALAMARLIRERGLATEVADGALCASSCPLVLAGGLTRTVAAGAEIGVHQFYASRDLTEDPAQVMVDAQLTTVRIVRYLQEMGVDPALWFNALATPPQSLYYLSRQEMADYRLVTDRDQASRGRGA